jgi:hypothetical protein
LHGPGVSARYARKTLDTNRKRRKLRKLRRQYGEVVTYVDRSCFERLRTKYLSNET